MNPTLSTLETIPSHPIQDFGISARRESPQKDRTSPSLAGRTSPVLCPELQHAHLQSKVLGLDPWMLEFQNNMPKLPQDPFSSSEPEKAVTTHLKWDVKNVDFQNKILSATATYQYFNNVEGNDSLVLDVKNLEIESILVNGKEIKYEVKLTKPPKPNDALHITIPDKKGPGEVVINYKTPPDASGIFWVDGKYTEGKKPLLYTLFEPTEGASAIPGQHTPQVRLTYEVNVNTGSPELMALSSAFNNPTERSLDGRYNGLRMHRTVPLYLLSLHVGNFNFRQYDSKTGVYAEDAMLEQAAASFKLLPEYLKAAEEICGPYNWGVYRPILMPWAFPYMAMEHPCASTCGAVCLEQPSVLPHEIAHSWTGNDITNCNWQQFCLNEGFTTFVEFLICAKIWGLEYAKLIFLYTLEEAKEAMAEFREKNPEILKLCAKEPVFEFSRIPYAKGALFLFMLREALGHESFAQFFKDYTKVFYQNTISDDRFLTFLKLWLEKKKGISDFETFSAQHKIHEWLYGTEFPSNMPEVKSKLNDDIDAEVSKTVQGQPVDKEKVNSWDVPMQLMFLARLNKQATKEQVALLDKQMGFTKSQSMSILGAWSLLCASTGHFTSETEQAICTYVIKRNSLHEANKIGAALCKTPEGKAIAQKILNLEQGRLFPVTRDALQKKVEGATK